MCYRRVYSVRFLFASPPPRGVYRMAKFGPSGTASGSSGTAANPTVVVHEFIITQNP